MTTSNVSAESLAPPSPPTRGFLGHYRQITTDPLRFFRESVRTYGDLVYLRVGKINIYLINDPEDIERMLVTENRNFLKPKLLHLAEETLGRGLLTSEGKFWLRQRRLAAPAFHKKRIEEYGRTMVEKTEKMLDFWNRTRHVDLHATMMALTLEIVTTTLFGTDIDQEEERRVGHILEVALDRFMDYQSFAYIFFDWLPRPKKLRFQKAKRGLDEIIFEIIKERRASGITPEDDPTLLGMYLAARDDDGSGMSDEQLRDEAITIFLAGHETTANLLTFAFYLLSRNPKKRELLEEELDRVLGNRNPTVDDLPNLTFAKQVVKETLRLFPPAWRVGRENIESWKIGKHEIPPKSQIFACQWILHRDPRWFNEPEEFLPERWTEEFEAGLPRYAYFPFGGGPRLCIGYAFAEMEAALVLSTIARQVRLNYSEESEPELYPSITLRPRDGLRVEIQRRS
ncbi:MAG: cytochrome P450 [Candidatus Kapaibacterium sp.]